MDGSLQTKQQSGLNLLQHSKGRVLLFTLLYASEGAPIGFIWWALPTLLRTQGVAVGRITGLTALLVLPWTCKFLWAPLIDWLRTPRWGFRAWIMSAQLLMGISLLPLLRLDPVADFSWWGALLLAHAFSAATQDVAVDALAVRIIPAGERGTINGCMQAGMLLGRSLFGGGALLVAAQLGREWIFAGLILCIWSSLFLLLFVREPYAKSESPAGIATVARNLQKGFRRRAAWLGLLFALLSAAAFEAVGALAGPYLTDRQISSETIGWFFAVPVVVATVSGGLTGGRLADRLGHIRAVSVFLPGFVAMVMALGLLELYGIRAPLALLGVLTGMYFFIGLFTAASYALFMDLTDPEIGASQFSAYMAATNGCEAWSGWAGGQIVTRAGYAAVFFLMSLVSLLSLPLLQWLRRTERENTRKENE